MTAVPASTGLEPNLLVEQIYRPILRGYFAVAAIYYVIMTLTHFWTLGGMGLVAMVAVSTIASIVFAVGFFALRKPHAISNLEAFTTGINLLMLANVMVAVNIEFAQAKLTYFIMLVMIFALASMTMRQAMLSIGAVLVGLFYVLMKHAPDQLDVYGFITFAAALSALAITFFLRRAIAITATARHEAESRLREAEDMGEQMRVRSLSDSLTGLPNRRSFFDSFQSAKQEAKSGGGAWLILLDLDGFKAVNDGYGHMIGDELLKAVARRMSDFCGEGVHLSRMGGDEFNIILPNKSGEIDVELWCQQLLDYVAEVYLIADRLVQISASAGCNRIRSDEHDAQLIRDADYALLHAKKHGKNRVIVFREEHAKDAAERFQIEQALRVADFNREIELLFQPQFDLSEGRVVRAEALARWNSPIIGDIVPDRFIEIAEESGLIANITLAVLDKSLFALKHWDNPVPLSINLSGHDLISDQIIDQIVERVKDSGLDPTMLEFEVTETAMMADTRKASINMLRLSELGHPVALDDFGTGYSNFSYLRTLPISKLKVDRSFMDDVADPMTEKILHSLVGMARTLGVHCLLEGVENEIQLLMAKRVGSHLVQGYLFGVPMNATELFSYLEEQDRPAVSQPKREAV